MFGLHSPVRITAKNERARPRWMTTTQQARSASRPNPTAGNPDLDSRDTSLQWLKGTVGGRAARYPPCLHRPSIVKGDSETCLSLYARECVTLYARADRR